MTKLTIFLLILLIVAFTHAGKKDELQSAIGFLINKGFSATMGQFPYQANIYYNGRFQCGASIIHKRWLLTAAHCKVGENLANYYVNVGTIYRSGLNGQTISIERFIQHEEYASNKTANVGSTTLEDMSNDIALIRSSDDIRFNGIVTLIKLARDDSNTYDNVTAIVSGLGCTLEVLQPEELQYVEVKVISDAECEKSWAELQWITFRQTICTSVINEKGTCNGDSGGPLVFRDEQIGVACAAHPNSTRSIPNIYTRVSPFIPWIDQQLMAYSNVLP